VSIKRQRKTVVSIKQVWHDEAVNMLCRAFPQDTFKLYMSLIMKSKDNFEEYFNTFYDDLFYVSNS